MPRFTPRVDVLETRMVLSAVNLTPAAYGVARGRIVQAGKGLAATGDVVRADAALERAVRAIPAGGALLPTLEAEVASGPASPRTLVDSLNNFIRDRVASGDISVRSAWLRKTLGLTSPSPAPPASTPTPTSPAPTPPAPTSPAPVAPVPSSLSATILNGTISQVDVSFTQAVDGVQTQLTGVTIGAGGTARFVPIITQNSSPITVSFQSPSLGYWQVVAPANFSQLQIASQFGRGYFYFK